VFKSVLKRMFGCKGSVLLTAVSIASFLMSSAFPFLNGRFVDFLVYDTSMNAVISFSFVLAGVGLLSVIFSYIAGIVSVKVSSETSFSILAEIIGRFQHADLKHVEEMENGYTSQRITTDANAVTSFVISNYLSVILNALLVIFVLVMFAFIDFMLFLLSLGLIAAYVFLFVKIKDPLYVASFKKKEADSVFFNIINSQVSQVFDIQLAADFEGYQRELHRAFEQYLPVVVAQGRISYLFSSIDGMVSTLFQVIVLLFAGIRIVRGEMTIGELTMAITYFTMVMQSAKYYIGFFSQYQDAKASFSRIGSIESIHELYDGSMRIDHIRQIEVNDLTYSIRQSGRKRVLFDGLCAVFNRGESIAVMGPNGSGKSTLLKLLTGLYDSNDSVLYDGHPLRDLSIESVRRLCFSAVPQSLNANAMTVREYIAFKTRVDVKSVHLLLRESNHKVPEMVAKVQNLLDKKCEQLSGGELKLLVLWLALRKPADVLILDEPCAGLDDKAKGELMSYISRNPSHQMIIVMTHDRKLASVTDEIVHL